MSLSDELLNTLWELDTFFNRMTDIFVVLSESLRVSFSLDAMIGCERYGR